VRAPPPPFRRFQKVPGMQIAYAAHTEACTFFLDDEGICRRVLRLRRATLLGVGSAANGASDEIDAAERCLGAQYVASLDFEAKGGLIALPRVGVPMIFAYVAKGGRITLVRTGPVTRFEENGVAKPDSGVRARPGDDSIPVMIDEEEDAPPTLDDEAPDESRTKVFRSTRPPPMYSMRVPAPAPLSHRTPVPYRPSLPQILPAPRTTPPEGRPSWMPTTRVERISMTPPPSTIREADPSAPTLRNPSRVTSQSPPSSDASRARGRGMLPVRASATRGRG
jgi:hypothetical protein